MSRFFISGLINLETTLAIEGFPLVYFTVRYPFMAYKRPFQAWDSTSLKP